MLGVKLTLFWVGISLRRARLDLVNNNLGANVFPAGETNVGKVSVPRKVNLEHPGWIWFVQCPGLICLVARWYGPASSARRLSAFLDYILRVCQSLLDSFLYLGKLHWFLYLMLSYFYDPSMFSYRCVGKVAWRPRCHLVPPTLCIILYYIYL